MWNCVEERIDQGKKYGRVLRKVIFEDIYTDRGQVRHYLFILFLLLTY